MLKARWIKISWQIRWALTADPYAAVQVWSEALYSRDERSLIDLILEEYQQDVEAAMQNPVVILVLWVRRIAAKLVCGNSPF